jgi:hypothetical protein
VADRKEPGLDIATKGLPPGTSFYPPPNNAIIYESIERLICSLGQGTHDLIASGNAVTHTLRGELH